MYQSAIDVASGHAVTASVYFSLVDLHVVFVVFYYSLVASQYSSGVVILDSKYLRLDVDLDLRIDRGSDKFLCIVLHLLKATSIRRMQKEKQQLDIELERINSPSTL